MHAVHALLVDLEADRARQMGFVPKPAYFGPGTFDEVCRELGRELRAADEHTHVALEALVLLLGARAGRYTRRGQKQRPPWFARALEFVHASYTESIAVSDVARAAGVHPVTLASAFRLHLGRSTAQYILDLRVDHARRELLGSREPVAAIAGRAGFYDESHLGRVFRRRFGRSPGSMRRGD